MYGNELLDKVKQLREKKATIQKELDRYNKIRQDLVNLYNEEKATLSTSNWTYSKDIEHINETVHAMNDIWTVIVHIDSKVQNVRIKMNRVNSTLNELV